MIGTRRISPSIRDDGRISGRRSPKAYAPTASLTGDRASNSGNVPALPTAVSTGLALSLLQWSRH